jgi:hypothetical protein
VNGVMDVLYPLSNMPRGIYGNSPKVLEENNIKISRTYYKV